LLEVNFSGLASCRLLRPAAIRQVAICRRRDRMPSPAAREFVELAKSRIKHSLRPGIQTEG
jgi:hypothetical protein